jgi:outer membrane protein assembly factor BamB
LTRDAAGRRSAFLRLASAAVAPLFAPFARGSAIAQATTLATAKTAGAASPVSPDEWPQFRGEPRLRGVAPSPPAALTLAWTHEAGEAIESSAAIAAGVVYVGAQPGKLLALDLRTGARLWAYESGDIGESSPCVAGGLVYVGDLEGTVHAVEARTGQAAWTFKARTEVKASPVVAEGKVLVGSYDQNLYALDAKTGAKAWAFETEGQVHATTAVAGGVAFVTGCDALLRAIRVADGQELYHVSSGAYTAASPALVGDHAYYGTFENEVLGVDLAARKVLWRYKPTERQFPFYSSAAVDQDLVVLGGRDKLVHALQADTGKPRWTFATRGRVDSSPVIAGGRAYVGSADGRVYALDLVDGRAVADFDTGGPITASPALAGGRLVIGTQDGQVFCLGPKS